MTRPSTESVLRERDDALRRAASLSRIVELINSELDLQPLLSRIAESAVELSGARWGTIGLVVETPAGRVVRTFARVNVPEEDPEPDVAEGDGLSWRVIHERRAICLDRYGDVATPVLLEKLPQYADIAVACIPIWWAGEVIGTFAAGDAQPRRFDDDDVELLTAFARHAAIAIHNARSVDDLQHALATTRLMHETSRRIGAATTEMDLIAAYLDQVAAGSHYQGSVALFDTDADGRRTELLIRRRLSASHQGPLEELRFPYEAWAPELAKRIDAGEMVLVRDVRTDPRISVELRRLQLELRLPAVALIPLIAREQRLGFVALTYSEPHDWREADLQPFQVTAAQLAIAIESRRQQTQLIEQEQRLAVLEERRRLARELHDSVTQSLASMNLLIQAMPRLWAADPERAIRALNQVGDLTRASLVEMRGLLFELLPAGEEGGGLAAYLRQCADRFQESTDATVDLEADASVAVPDDVAHALRRIIREALANAARYAGAGRVSLALTGGDTVRLRIADDGRGFDPAAVSSGRLGLVSMRERAEGVGARFHLRSAPGAGTAIVVEWPAAGTSHAEE